MENIDEIGIINAVIPYAANGPHCDIRLSDPLLNIAESGLDSMDVAIMSAYLCELFDVAIELQRDIPTDTVRAMFGYVRQHGRRQITRAAQVEEMLAP